MLTIVNIIHGKMSNIYENHMPDFTDDNPNLSGLKIKGRYVLLEEIGQGLMARAYLAHDELLEGEVVVKVINTEIAGIKIPLGPEWVQEAKRAMKVRGCPFIASVTDFGEEICELESQKMNIPFIVWERVYGLTLQQYIDEKCKIDEGMIIATLVQLLQVLIALHRSNVIHGDLHVKNVIYDNVTASRHFVKVIDFGLANVVASDGDFHRDRHGTAKIICQILDAFRQQDREGDKKIFIDEVESIANNLSEKKNLTSNDLQSFLSSAEELERKFLLGAEWLQSVTKHRPLGYESEKYLKSVSRPDLSELVGSEPLDELFGWLKNGLDDELGRVLSLQGEIGLGKSRWSLEILQKLASDDKELFVMRSSAYPGDNNRPFEPVRRLWKSFLGEEETDRYSDYLNDMFPEIPLIVNPLTELLTSEQNGKSGTNVMLDETNYLKLITTGFKHLALKNGLVICIDDLNYADHQTLTLIKDLSVATIRYPIVLVFTFNNLREDKFAKFVDELSIRENYLNYGIPELDIKQTQQLISGMYNWENYEDPQKLAHLLYPMIGGNPFYIRETLKFYENHRYIMRDQEAFKLVKKIDISDNPRTVQSLMMERVNSLDEKTQNLVQWGSILGSTFQIDHLSEMVEVSEGEVAEILDNLAHNHHMFAKSEHRYTFMPVMLYNIIYSSIEAESKKKMHLKAVEILKAKVHHDPKLNAAIAEHYVKSGLVSDDIAEYYFKASNHALKSNLKAQAAEWCDLGIDILEQGESRNEYLMSRFYLFKGLLSRQSGDANGYRENTFNAYNCAVLSRDRYLEGKALKALGEYYRSIADYRSSVDYYNNSLNIMEDLKDDREIALTLKELSTSYCFMGKFDDAISALNRSKEISEELNDREGMARIYNNLGLIYKILGDIKMAKEWLDRSIRLFREIDDIQGEVLPIGNMAIIYTEEGEFERAMILLKEISSSEKRLTDTRIAAKVHVTLGDVLFELGEYRETMEYFERALRVFRALGDRQGECEALTNMAFICLEQNKINLAESYSKLALQIKEEIGYERGIPYNNLISARVARITENYEKSIEIINNSLELPLLQSSNWLKLSFLLEDALVSVECGQTKMAQNRFYEISTLIDQLGEKVPKTFKILFWAHFGEFMISQGEKEIGENLKLESKNILEELERKIFQMKWREKFRRKYESLINVKDKNQIAVAV